MADEVTALKERIHELEELNRLTEVLSRTLDLSRTLQLILECSIRVCGADRGAIVLFIPGQPSDGRTILRSTSQGKEVIDHRLNTLVAGCLRRTKKAFVTDNLLEAFDMQSPDAFLLNHGPALAVPLISDEVLLGMIHHVNDQGGVTFSADRIRVAEIVARMASQYVARAKLHETLCTDLNELKHTVAERDGSRTMLGNSKAMQQVFRDISLVAPTSANVLIIGETGTGKELTARAIHAKSPRLGKPFVAVNCAAIPADLFESELFGHERGAFTGASALLKGKFELADGGTLFLDEVSEMPVALQAKLLRVLEEKRFCRVGSSEEIHVDVRVIAASSKDLKEAAEQGEFRDALFHRLNVVPVVLPPLRDRKDDIPLLAQEMLKEISSGAKIFEQDALALLQSQEWKGNVRQLRNTVERISIFVPHHFIDAGHIRALGTCTETVTGGRSASFLRELLSTLAGKENLVEYLELELIRLALSECDGNVSQAARMIGLDRMALQRRIEKFNLQ